jgi:hypothetical protein
MMGPNEGVTTESPIDTIRSRKKDRELRPAFRMATAKLAQLR